MDTKKSGGKRIISPGFIEPLELKSNIIYVVLEYNPSKTGVYVSVYSNGKISVPERRVVSSGYKAALIGNLEESIQESYSKFLEGLEHENKAAVDYSRLIKQGLDKQKFFDDITKELIKFAGAEFLQYVKAKLGN